MSHTICKKFVRITAEAHAALDELARRTKTAEGDLTGWLFRPLSAGEAVSKAILRRLEELRAEQDKPAAAAAAASTRRSSKPSTKKPIAKKSTKPRPGKKSRAGRQR